MRMSMRKFFLKVWYALDPLYSALIRLQPLVPASQEDIVFRTRLTKFNGKNVLLSDGTEIHKNDILLKIHFPFRSLNSISYYIKSNNLSNIHFFIITN